jgi:hypothetical protein
MQTFKVNFSRYLNGKTRISSPQWIGGESLYEVAGKAELMLGAMRGADPESAFAVNSIDAQHHGEECNGARMWETAEELAARVSADAKPA